MANCTLFIYLANATCKIDETYAKLNFTSLCKYIFEITVSHNTFLTEKWIARGSIGIGEIT